MYRSNRPRERSNMREKDVKRPKNYVTNSHLRDSGGKIMFDDFDTTIQSDEFAWKYEEEISDGEEEV